MSADALTRFMEMFDKGSFPGGDGKMRYVGRTLFILTSNKNSDRILSHDVIKGMTRAELDRRVAAISEDTLKKAFTEKASYTDAEGKKVKPAVLERVDRIYFAAPLLKAEAVQVAQIEINRFISNYHKQSETKLVADPSLAEVLTSAFYNESLGARQIRTNVQLYLSRLIDRFKEQNGHKADEITVSASNHPSLKTVSYLKAQNPDGQTLTIDGPRIPVDNKLLDADFRRTLVNLEEALKAEIFGQPEAVRALVAAVKARFIEGKNGSPVAGFLLGMTGSGKSELAKVLARSLFGREEAVGLFEMGRVQHESDLNTILSPGKGIIGSDQPGELEQFLIRFPEGGVLLFDEMSNAGGANISLKQAIAKQFYTMLQEGYYRSPSGKVYPLNNHIIMFTGNDGEHIFKGVQSDSLLIETYNEVSKDPLFVKNLLSQAGFTDAFIGRLAFSVFMRPTIGEVKTKIAQKMLNQWKKLVESSQPAEIEFSEGIAEEVGALMFSPKTGARSIRAFVLKFLGDAVATQMLAVDWDPLLATGKKMRIKVKVESTRPDRPFYDGAEPDKREALLKVDTYVGRGRVSQGQVDFTKDAFFMPQVHIDNAMATAAHEMGHAVTAFTEITGEKVVKVTIVPESIGGVLSAAGYTQYRSGSHRSKPDWDFMVAHLAGLLAGSETEILYVPGQDPNAGRSNDLQRVGSMAKRFILDYHLMPELDAAHAYGSPESDVYQNLPRPLKRKFDQLVAKAIADGRALAQKTIAEKRPLIDAGIEFLRHFGGVMNEKEYEKLETQFEQAREQNRAFRPNLDEIREEAKRSTCQENLTGS